jgi:hypothetical protein
MRNDAAQCELDGPLITGPITSLNMLGKLLMELKYLNTSYRFFFQNASMVLLI